MVILGNYNGFQILIGESGIRDICYLIMDFNAIYIMTAHKTIVYFGYKVWNDYRPFFSFRNNNDALIYLIIDDSVYRAVSVIVFVDNDLFQTAAFKECIASNGRNTAWKLHTHKAFTIVEGRLCQRGNPLKHRYALQIGISERKSVNLGYGSGDNYMLGTCKVFDGIALPIYVIR